MPWKPVITGWFLTGQQHTVFLIVLSYRRLCSPHQFGPSFRSISPHCIAHLHRQITVAHISTPCQVSSSALPLLMWIKWDFNQHSGWSLRSFCCHMYEKHNEITAGMANLPPPSSPGLLSVCVCVCVLCVLCAVIRADRLFSVFRKEV